MPISPDILDRLQKNDPDLTELSLTETQYLTSNCSVTHFDIMQLAKILQQNTTLTKLEISGKQVTDVSVLLLADTLRVNQALEILTLQHNIITDKGAEALASALTFNKTLRALDLRGNSITETGALALANMLKINKTLTELYVGANKIELPGIKALLQHSKEKTGLRKLQLSHSKLGDKEILAITTEPIIAKSISALDLSHNHITNQGAIDLATLLTSNLKLTVLDLAINKIANEGASAIAHALAINHYLIKLVLYKNHISDSGILAIAEALTTNRTLKSLDLRFNQLSQKVFLILLSKLQKNSTLTQLFLTCGNKVLTADSIQALFNFFQINTTLITLSLGANPFHCDADKNFFTTELEKNATLETSIIRYDIMIRRKSLLSTSLIQQSIRSAAKQIRATSSIESEQIIEQLLIEAHDELKTLELFFWQTGRMIPRCYNALDLTGKLEDSPEFIKIFQILTSAAKHAYYLFFHFKEHKSYKLLASINTCYLVLYQNLGDNEKALEKAIETIQWLAHFRQTDEDFSWAYHACLAIFDEIEKNDYSADLVKQKFITILHAFSFDFAVALYYSEIPREHLEHFNIAENLSLKFQLPPSITQFSPQPRTTMIFHRGPTHAWHSPT
jgi:Ran GTPase-activating protein (RanGAP) involved in mRNA processing and transport